MGWASAGEIFDPVAQALIDLGASREVKRHVLGILISNLQDGDWDTEFESLQEFRHDVDIVALFHERGVGSNLYGRDDDGTLGYDDTRDLWVLACGSCGPLDSGSGTAEEHDRLVHVWAAHDADAHGGDGGVSDYLLIGEAQ